MEAAADATMTSVAKLRESRALALLGNHRRRAQSAHIRARLLWGMVSKGGRTLIFPRVTILRGLNFCPFYLLIGGNGCEAWVNIANLGFNSKKIFFETLKYSHGKTFGCFIIKT